MARDPTDSAAAARTRPEPRGSSVERRWAVVYDPDCGFCRWSLSQLLALDRTRRLRPVALGTEEADGLLADLTAAERRESWHLVSPDGRRASAGAAGAPLLAVLPFGGQLAALLQRMPRTTDRGYRWIADHRPTLSRLISRRARQRADQRIARRVA